MAGFEKAEYWLKLSEDDIATAKWLLNGKKCRELLVESEGLLCWIKKKLEE
jgi:hypothetical protein